MSVATKPLPIDLLPPPRVLGSHRDVTFTEEPFSALRYEAGHLFEAHYEEASADLTVPLRVNWDVYQRLERAGLEVCVVVRRSGWVIGYAVYILAPHLHYDTTVADADVFYLDPRFRSGWIGVRLFREADALLKTKGVDEVVNRVKLHVQPGRGGRDLGGIFRWLGYRPVETLWRKRIS